MIHVIGDWQEHATCARGPIGQPIGWTGHDLRHQFRACLGRIAHAIPSLLQKGECMNHGGGGVEPHPIGQAAIFIGVIGENQRDLALRRCASAQLGPIGREGCDKGDAISAGFIGRNRAFGGLIEKGLALKADCARQNAAIHLRQSHIHRDVTGREAVGAFLPTGLGAGCQHDLQHRRLAG